MNILITSVGGPLVKPLTKFLKKDEQLNISNIIGIDQKKKYQKIIICINFTRLKKNHLII